MDENYFNDKAPLQVFSIFHSISGEISLWPQGTPVVFIRLAGCNLRCSYCDTEDSLPVTSGEEWSVGEILEEIRSTPVDKVIVTGGEPMVQPNLVPLLRALRREGYKIAVETNGSRSLRDRILEADLWVMDIKMPGSRMFDQMLPPEEYSHPVIQLKVVCQCKDDFNKAIECLNKIKHHRTPALSAAYPLTPAKLWDMIRATGSRYILNTQVHKFIWPDSKTEV